MCCAAMDYMLLRAASNLQCNRIVSSFSRVGTRTSITYSGRRSMMDFEFESMAKVPASSYNPLVYMAMATFCYRKTRKNLNALTVLTW